MHQSLSERTEPRLRAQAGHRSTQEACAARKVAGLLGGDANVHRGGGVGHVVQTNSRQRMQDRWGGLRRVGESDDRENPRIVTGCAHGRGRVDEVPASRVAGACPPTPVRDGNQGPQRRVGIALVPNAPRERDEDLRRARLRPNVDADHLAEPSESRRLVHLILVRSRLGQESFHSDAESELVGDLRRRCETLGPRARVGCELGRSLERGTG